MNMDNIKIGIVVADIDEYKPLAEFIEKQTFEVYNFLGRTGHKFEISAKNKTAQVFSVLCGIGKVNATAAAMHLVDIGCDVILNYGLSGGISGVRRGEICICDRYLEHDFDLSGIGYGLCEKPSQKYIYNADQGLISLFKGILPEVKCGTAVTGDRFICSAQDRDLMKTNFNAMCCDMETAAIAYVCDFSSTPFLAVRRISDDAGADALENYREMNTSKETLLSDLIIELIKALI